MLVPSLENSFCITSSSPLVRVAGACFGYRCVPIELSGTGCHSRVFDKITRVGTVLQENACTNSDLGGPAERPWSLERVIVKVDVDVVFWSFLDPPRKTARQRCKNILFEVRVGGSSHCQPREMLRRNGPSTNTRF